MVMKRMIKTITFLLAIFCSESFYSETAIPSGLDHIYHFPFKNADEVINSGKTILATSTEDDEISLGYYHLFMGYFLKGDYSNSILYAKKGDLFFLKHHRPEDHFMASYYLSLAYQKSGFMKQAYQSLEETEKIARKLKIADFSAMTLRIRANFLENQKRYQEAISYRIKSLEYTHQKNKQTVMAVSQFRAGHCFLAFDYLMTENIIQAKKQLAIFEGYKKDAAYYNYRIEVYYACKAIIAARESKKEEAVMFFDKAVDAAKKSETYEQLTILLEQRLTLNIDSFERREQLFREFIQLKDRSKKESIEVITEEINSRNAELRLQKEYKYIMILAGILLSAGVIVFKKRKRENQKKHFENIIKELESKKAAASDGLKIVINNDLQKSSGEESEDPASVSLLEETEIELLEKLEVFETKNAFTAKNFTLNNFVTILDTNTKYVNYLLKEHRGKTFSEYINDLRIEYILNYLNDNPESLKYKLTHLSDLAGFSSHSYFTKVFTKKTKITPSKFISSLKEKNKNTEREIDQAV